jgi:hypothetical protein
VRARRGDRRHSNAGVELALASLALRGYPHHVDLSFPFPQSLTKRSSVSGVGRDKSDNPAIPQSTQTNHSHSRDERSTMPVDPSIAGSVSRQTAR